MADTKRTIYTYVNCDTCRRAVKWLRAQGIAFDERPIRETPPSPAELRAMLAAGNGCSTRRAVTIANRSWVNACPA
jgi:arsenate reductase